MIDGLSFESTIKAIGYRKHKVSMTTYAFPGRKYDTMQNEWQFFLKFRPF